MARLGDLCRFINGDRGRNYPSQAEISSDGDVPFINAGHLVDGKLDFSDMNYISEEKYNQLNSGKIQENDVLYCLRGSLGKKAIIKGISKGVIASSLVIIRPDARRINSDYLFYALESPRVQEQMMQANNGSSQPNLSAKSVSDYTFNLPDIDVQIEVVSKLAKVNDLITLRREQLAKLDQLVKSRFMEMFGDPILNSKGLPIVALGKACYLKAGITTAADAIHEQSMEYPIPCYGGNGIRGYVKEATQNGMYPIIGRQGALCGNVQLATGKFHATEHAVLVTPLVETDIFWLFYLLKYMDLYRFHTGAAQPGLAVKTLNTIDIPVVDINSQHRFSAFATEVEKSKLTIQASLDKLELLKKSLMQQYFG